MCVCVCEKLPASVVCVGALGVVDVTGEHVVVHVDGAAVVDGVAQPLRHDGLTGVRRQTQLEETGLRGGEAVVRLWRKRTQKLALTERHKSFQVIRKTLSDPSTLKPPHCDLKGDL